MSHLYTAFRAANPNVVDHNAKIHKGHLDTLVIMTGKTGIVKRTIKNDSSTRGSISGMITDTLSSCIDMPSGSNTIHDVNDLADGMMRA